MRSMLDQWRGLSHERKAGLEVALVIAFGIALRSVNLFSPYLLDAHSFRQGDTAGFAMGYLTQSFNPLTPSIVRQPCFTPEPFGQVEAELPLYAWFAVAPLKLFGASFPNPTYLRCVWLAYFAAACVYLYRLVRQLGESHAIGVLALGTLCVLPLAVFFTVSIQPEGPSLTLAFAFLFYLTRYLQKRASSDEIKSVALAALLLLFKLSNAYLGFAAIFLIVTHEGWKELLRRRRYWLWLAMITLPVGDWYWYSKQVAAWSFGIWDDTTSSPKWSSLANLTDASIWKRLAHRSFETIFSWAGIALMGIGFASFRRSLTVKLAAACGLGFLVFLLLTLPVNVVHTYYQLPAVVPAVLTIPFAVRALWSNVAGRIALIVLALIHGFAMHRILAPNHSVLPNMAHKRGGFFTEDPTYLPGIELVRNRVPKGERFASTSGAPELFYNSRHSGFMAPKMQTMENVQRCLTQSGVHYFLVDPNQGQLLNDWVKAAGGRLLSESDGFLLYRFQ